ncbi:MAG TPA: hypothetical protein VM683_00365 [Anaeromyxobacteraceae bacterium]|jgi:hypothetical protein|nr:hypothetical protein [Anaeromyxobacteraceae bacterium]
MTHETTDAPAFRVHATLPALVRGLWVAALCTALTAGFLSQVWRAPTEAELHAERCNAALQAHAC